MCVLCPPRPTIAVPAISSGKQPFPCNVLILWVPESVQSVSGMLPKGPRSPRNRGAELADAEHKIDKDRSEIVAPEFAATSLVTRGVLIPREAPAIAFEWNHSGVLRIGASPMGLKIEDYALIGDCKTAALVGRNGSIDWLCWPRLDSPACFAALLGTRDHGYWLIAPKDQPCRMTRCYRPGTLVLETEFRTEAGSAVLTDFMRIENGAADLVRIVHGQSGRVVFSTECVVRFNYGSAIPWVSQIDSNTTDAIAGPERLLLRTSVSLRHEAQKTVGNSQSKPVSRFHLSSPTGLRLTIHQRPSMPTRH